MNLEDELEEIGRQFCEEKGIRMTGHNERGVRWK